MACNRSPENSKNGFGNSDKTRLFHRGIVVVLWSHRSRSCPTTVVTRAAMKVIVLSSIETARDRQYVIEYRCKMLGLLLGGELFDGLSSHGRCR